jgi:hypothetical protein
VKFFTGLGKIGPTLKNSKQNDGVLADVVYKKETTSDKDCRDRSDSKLALLIRAGCYRFP